MNEPSNFGRLGFSNLGSETPPASSAGGASPYWPGSPLAGGSPALCRLPNGSSPLAMDSAGEVVFTYDVKWEYSAIKWASRWDTYLLMGDEQIHW